MRLIAALYRLFLPDKRSPERAAWEAKKPSDSLFTVFHRGGEIYVWCYTPETSGGAIRKAADWAANKELSLNWQDVVKVYDSINASVDECEMGGDAK